jgi:hypothetical protein
LPAAAPAGKLSTADILAAARAKKAAASDGAETVEAAPMAAREPAAAKPVVEMPAKPAASKATFAPGQRPGVAEILAWCREHDTK